jgi:predicted permease
MALLIASGLLIRTFVNLMRTDAGIDATNVIAGQMSLAGARYDTSEKAAQFFEKGLERIRGIPNVESAAVITNLPMERGMNIVAYVPDSNEPDKPRLTDWRYVTTDYFRTLRIPVVAGRAFTEADGNAAAAVAIINRRFADMYFSGMNPVGRALKLDPGRTQRTVVGIVGDTKQETLTQPGPAMLFVPVAQAPDELVRSAHSWFPVQWVIRTRDSGHGIIAAVQRELGGIDALTPISGFRTLDEVRGAAVRPWRFMMVLVSVFAGLALLLAAAGIYGVISYQVESRTHEMGVLLALGATAGDLIRSVVARGLGAAAIGVAIGVVASIWSAKLVSSQLFGVQPTDLATLASAGLFLLAIAVLASLIPALRVTRLNPARALRVE